MVRSERGDREQRHSKRVSREGGRDRAEEIAPVHKRPEEPRSAIASASLFTNGDMYSTTFHDFSTYCGNRCAVGS